MLDADPVTVAVHVVAWPDMRSEGAQVTVVVDDDTPKWPSEAEAGATAASGRTSEAARRTRRSARA